MLEVKNVSKTFQLPGTDKGIATHALRNVGLSVEQGEFVSIVGRSGSGKSTLLGVMSTLITPDSGEIFFQNSPLAELTQAELDRLRHTDFGIIFQFHHLMPFMTAQENVLLPFMNSLRPVDSALKRRAEESLERVGLSHRKNNLPAQLSGGEQQRVAIARALVKQSTILFADEPTGSLDTETGDAIMALLSDLSRDGLTVVMVTHNPDYAALADRTLHMRDGELVEEKIFDAVCT